MTTFTITLAADEIPLGEFEAATALDAATAAHRTWLSDNKEPVDGYAYEQHGANWGGAAERSTGYGNGAQSFNDCLRVYSDLEMQSRVAVVQYRKTDDDDDDRF